MKKIIALILSIAVLLVCIACGEQEVIVDEIEAKPEVTEMRMICELAVMECYYHNVAKYFEKDAEKGFLGIGKKDKRFWIEYSGVVKFGVDMEKVSIDVREDVITITLPKASVLNCKLDTSSLSKDSFVVDKKSAAVTADDQVRAFNEAQMKLEEVAKNDKVLLDSAQKRVMTLLENYINNISAAIGKQYEIKWMILDENDAPVDSTEPVNTETETAIASKATA